MDNLSDFNIWKNKTKIPESFDTKPAGKMIPFTKKPTPVKTIQSRLENRIVLLETRLNKLEKIIKYYFRKNQRRFQTIESKANQIMNPVNINENNHKQK